MRLLVNNWCGLGPPAGIGHYAAQLTAALRQTAGPDDSVASFPAGWWAEMYRQCTAVPKRLTKLPRQTGTAAPSIGSKFRQGLAQFWPESLSEVAHSALRRSLGWVLQRQFRSTNATVYHEPNFIPLTYAVPFAITIHDLSPVIYPQWHPIYRVRWLERHLPDSLRQARYIFTVSRFSRDELVRRLGVSLDRVHVVYPGVRRHLRPIPSALLQARLRRIGLPPGYFLYVGTLEPRKNLERVLQTYLQLPRSQRWQVPFVLAGKYGWAAQRLAELICRAGPAEGVIQLGYVPDNWLATLYCGALALIYPSYYEGFGLPPVEMLACGGRVIVSDIPVFQETLGPYAVRVAAEDNDAWYRVLRQFARQDPADSLAQARQLWAARFDWLTCAAQTWKIYKSPPTAVRLAA